MSRRKGFTLIELVVVIAIIALLAVVIVGAIVVARRASQEAANRANGQAIKTAIENFYSRNRRYTVVAGTNWGPTAFDVVDDAGQPLANFGINLNTVGCANGGGDVQTTSDQAYTIRIFGVSGAGACTNTNVIETVTGP